MATKDETKAAGEAGAADVQAKFSEAESNGFFGEQVDPTPRENYTLRGVTSGKPTPETDRTK